MYMYVRITQLVEWVALGYLVVRSNPTPDNSTKHEFLMRIYVGEKSQLLLNVHIRACKACVCKCSLCSAITTTHVVAQRVAYVTLSQNVLQ